jgi:hypothetical protein
MGLSGEETTVFNAGRYVDRIVRDNGRVFRQKLCVFDSVLVPGPSSGRSETSRPPISDAKHEITAHNDCARRRNAGISSAELDGPSRGIADYLQFVRRPDGFEDFVHAAQYSLFDQILGAVAALEHW